MMNIVTGALVCVDCAMAIANGDLSGMSDGEARDWQTRVDKFDACEGGRWTVVIGATDEDGDDVGFCTSQCDYCGSYLAGTRLHATFIENN